MLLLPKLLPLAADAVRPRARRRAFGGGRRLLRATLAEIVFSVLMAPILMIQHSKAVVGILLGRCVTWNGAAARRRRARAGPRSLRSYGGTTLVGWLWALVAYLIAPGLLLWLSPVLVGLIAGDSARAALEPLRCRGWRRAAAAGS